MGLRIALPFRYESKLRAYEEALGAAGLEPVRIFASQPIDVDDCSGLLLIGGSDIDPSLYGEEPHPASDAADRERDNLELTLLRRFLDRDLPVLAICRGLQLFNIAHAGGTLIQDLPGHRVKNADASAPVHSVRIEPGSRLAGIIGCAECGVNSRHHQAAGRVGEGLIVTAMAPDGIIEALERPDRRFAVAVQWHPEEQIRTAPEQLRLFQAFASQASGPVAAPSHGA